MFSIPDIVARKARVAGAEEWLTSVHDLVDALCVRWGLTVDRILEGGTEAVVLAVDRHDGPAVLKMCIPRSGAHADREIAALSIAHGRGCAAMLESDGDVGALLLERLGPSLFDLAMPIRRRHRVMCAAAAEVWQPIAPGQFLTGADKGRWLIDFVLATWERTGRPCSERAVAAAIGCAERRIDAHDDERAVLVHGDVHQWNTLAPLGFADRDDAGDWDGRRDAGFKLIDPDGLHAEREYDLGVIMREDPIDLLDGDPRRRSRELAALTGGDETAIWEWGMIERLSTGLLCTEIELQPVGREMLVAAELVANGRESSGGVTT